MSKDKVFLCEIFGPFQSFGNESAHVEYLTKKQIYHLQKSILGECKFKLYDSKTGDLLETIHPKKGDFIKDIQQKLKAIANDD